MFGSSFSHSLITLEVISFTRKYIEIVGVSVRISGSKYFSFVEVSYEYVMVARLKRIYRANAIASFIFFVGDTQNPTYHEKSL